MEVGDVLDSVRQLSASVAVLRERLYNKPDIAMGPIRIRDTRIIVGKQIPYKLDQLLQWGETEYRSWFEEEIMGWAKATAASRGSKPSCRCV